MLYARHCRYTHLAQVVNKDEWPAAGAVEAGQWAIFSSYVSQVVLANFRNEVVWFTGVVYHACHGNVIKPEIMKSLVNDAIPNANLQLGVYLAAIELFSALFDHITDYCNRRGLFETAIRYNPLHAIR